MPAGEATYLEEGKKIKRNSLPTLNDNFHSFQGPTGLLAIEIMKVFLKY